MPAASGSGAAGPSPAQLEAYLHENIPLASAMGVSVVSCDARGAVLRAPLAPNINHHATVFGGSASAVALLAGWLWLYGALQTAGLAAKPVIQRNTMEYLVPVTEDFEAWCAAPATEVLAKFLKTLQRHRRARITLEVELVSGGQRVGFLTGEYVAAL
ncbi:MAG: thioesterase domain-containing protein [Verrucomicrobia bacterium]|nr:thioesterase domain-containing protein [Verrucomicrobiota bacterium]